MCSFVQYQAKSCVKGKIYSSLQDAESLGSVAVVFLVGEQEDSRHQVISRNNLQLGQLRLNPPGLGSKCGKRVERLCDF